MFDLFRSREKSVRYLLGGLLGVVALSMVITLVPGYGSLGGGTRDQTLIAEIGDDKITASEVRQIMERELRGNRIPPGMESIYIPMFVRQMVAQRAVALEAKRLGFSLSDQELSEIIATLVPQLFENGKFVGKDVYAAFLAQQNMTIPMFEARVRQESVSQKLESLALEGVVVRPQDVEDEFRHQNEKVKFSYFAISPDSFTAQAKPTQDEIQKYYNGNKSAYKIPAKRSYLIYAVDEKTIADSIALSEDDVRKAYQSNLDRYRSGERVKVRHILLDTTKVAKDQIPTVKKKAEDLLKQLQGGADFADLAKKNSADPGSAQNGGDLGWVTRGQTVPEFEKAAFSLKPKQLSGVVQTMYGFHIIQGEEKEEARVKPFEEVKGELETELKRTKSFDKMQQVADQIRGALMKSPADAERVAKANGITPVTVAAAGAGDPLPEVGINQQFNDAAGALQKGGITPVITVGTNKLVFAQVTNIIPERQAELSEVRSQVESTMVQNRAQELLRDKVREVESKLKAAPGDFAAIAKSLNVTVKTTEPVAVVGTIPEVGTAQQFASAYNKNVGAVVGPVPTPSGTVFARVEEKIPADLTQLAAQRQSILQTIKQRRAQERRDIFADGIVDGLMKEKKVKIYEQNIQKLATSFRG